MFDREAGVGGSDHPAQNPPRLDGLARLAVRFYRRTVSSPFARGHGLVPWRMDALGMDGTTMDIFIEMLGLIEGAAGGEMPRTEDEE